MVHSLMDVGSNLTAYVVSLSLLCAPTAAPVRPRSTLAAEALRSKSNDFNAALDALVDPAKRAALTLAASLRIATAAQQAEHDKGAEEVGQPDTYWVGKKQKRTL